MLDTDQCSEFTMLEWDMGRASQSPVSANTKYLKLSGNLPAI